MRKGDIFITFSADLDSLLKETDMKKMKKRFKADLRGKINEKALSHVVIFISHAKVNNQRLT